MVNEILSYTSCILMVSTIISKNLFNITNRLFYTSIFASITSICNHMTSFSLFKYIDRIYIPFYIIDNVLFIYNYKEQNQYIKYISLFFIFTAIIALFIAMILRRKLLKKQRILEDNFSVITLIHLYSHFILLICYHYLCKLQDKI